MNTSTKMLHIFFGIILSLLIAVASVNYSQTRSLFRSVEALDQEFIEFEEEIVSQGEGGLDGTGDSDQSKQDPRVTFVDDACPFGFTQYDLVNIEASICYLTTLGTARESEIVPDADERTGEGYELTFTGGELRVTFESSDFSVTGNENNNLFTSTDCLAKAENENETRQCFTDTVVDLYVATDQNGRDYIHAWLEGQQPGSPNVPEETYVLFVQDAFGPESFHMRAYSTNYVNPATRYVSDLVRVM